MRNGFKKLLESVQKQCPELITEQVFNDYMTEFDQGLAKVTADAQAEGQAIGFKEGYDEGKKVAQEQAQAELAALTEKMDTEAVEKLTSILEMIDEKDTAKLQQFYDYVKENMVSKEEMETALAEQDQDHATKFENAINQINDDHVEKLKQVNDVMTQNKAVAIESITNKYQQELDQAKNSLEEERKRKTSILAESVEKYINYALEQFIPKKQLVSEAKYNSAVKTLDKVTDLLKVHHIIQESKDGIFADYEQKLSQAKELQNKLITEKIELRAQLNKKEAQLLLEQKTQMCTPNEARFLKTYFKDANSPKVIEESIEAAHTAWKKLQSERRQALQESVDKKVNKIPSKIVTESKESVKKESLKKIISEQKLVANNPDQNLVDYYAKVLNKNK